MSKPKRAPPYSLRLGPKEREQAERAAGKMSLSSYIRSLLAAASAGPAEPDREHKKRVKRPTRDEQATAQAIALLGNSRVPNNVNQIAKAINEGRYPVGPEAEVELLGELQTITSLLSEIRALLMKPPGHSGSI